ncbi:C2 family cysteine protease [Streptomyces sp. NPDC021020]|uniref:C2 family cysteine protease n=1 Tax=Streptomyces sp. NPDC021020 TaxID=3365109 RepID=UPI0037970AD0
MTDFHGFDPDQLTTFAGTLDTLAGHAAGLHQQLTTLLNGAQQNLPPGQKASNDPALQQLVTVFPGVLWPPLPNQTAAPSGPNAPLPAKLTSELGTMQGEIKRRIAQLKGVQVFEAAGYPVDAASVFLDEKAPDGKKVDAALKALQALQHTDFGVNGDTDDLDKLAATLTGLTSAELDAVITKASPADLAHYNELMNDHGDSGWNPFDSNGVDADVRDATLDTLLSRLGPENFDKFLAAFPGLQPDFTGTGAYKDGENTQNGVNASGLHWGVPTDPLIADGVSVDDIHQRGLGDCWYFSSLCSVAQRDPKFLQDGIKQNPNGTVSVRVWDQRGNFRWVTVTPDLLVDGDGYPVSATGSGDTWPGYYEKAFAIAFGGDKGYGGIENNNPGKSVPYLTGHSGSDIKTGGFLGIGKHEDKSIADLKKIFDSGKAITVLTPDGDEDNPPADLPDGYHTDHAYYVRRFTSDGKIVLGNPWGSPSPEVVVSQEQFDKYFVDPQEFEIP